MSATHPEHAWVWVDGAMIDAVVIYREWLGLQRLVSDRLERETEQADVLQTAFPGQIVTDPDGEIGRKMIEVWNRGNP